MKKRKHALKAAMIDAFNAGYRDVELKFHSRYEVTTGASLAKSLLNNKRKAASKFGDRQYLRSAYMAGRWACEQDVKGMKEPT